jgi:hypothetical protein
MVLSRLRARGVLLAVAPALAAGLAAAAAAGPAHAEERPDRPVGVGEVSRTLHDRHGDGRAHRSAVGAAAASVLGDWNADGRADLIGRDGAGKLWLYTGTGQLNSPFNTRRQMGTGWQIYSALVRHGDWNVDGKQDILARDINGVLWYYKATGAATGSGHYARARVGGGWQIYSQLVGVDDWTNDGLDDLVAVDTAGKLWLYAGKGTGANFFQTRREIGHGWQIYNILTADGDLSGDGAAELTARDRNGRLWGYDSTGDPAKPYGTRFSLSEDDFSEVTAIAGVGDVDSGGLPDLLFRYNWGNLYVASVETPTHQDPVGGGWNIYNIIF